MKIAFARENMRKIYEGNRERGGAEKVLVELANEFSARGHEVTIFCTDVNSRDELMYPISPQVQCHNLLETKSADFTDRARHRFVRNFVALKRKIRWGLGNKNSRLSHLRRRRPSSGRVRIWGLGNKNSRLSRYVSKYDCKLDYFLYKHVLNWPRIIEQNSDVLVLFSYLDTFLHIHPMLSANRSFPIIYSIRNQVKPYFEVAATNPDRLARFNKTLELDDLILVLLPELIDQLPKPLQSKTLSIPNPVKPVDRHKRANPGLDTGLKTILAVGRLVPHKNHEILLKAFGQLSHKHPDWQVKIFGEGKLEKNLQDLVRKLKLQDKILLMGTVDTEVLDGEYQKAQMLAMPSKFEGFSLALAQAMAHGMPAVGLDNAGGVNSLIRHGHNGLLADGNNPVESLTSCLERLMTNPGLRVKLGQNGIESVKPFASKKVYDLWEKTILEARHNFNKEITTFKVRGHLP